MWFKIKFILETMERRNIITPLDFATGGTALFTVVNKREYFSFLYKEVKEIIDKTGKEELTFRNKELAANDLALNLNKRLDPDILVLKDWINGGKKPDDFENATTILLCMCGFRAIHLGGEYDSVTLRNRRSKYGLSQINIDILAFSCSGDEILVCQCSTDWNDQKITDILNITTEIRTDNMSSSGTARIFPVIVTCVSENQIQESLKIACSKAVTVITKEKLTVLLDELEENSLPYVTFRDMLIDNRG